MFKFTKTLRNERGKTERWDSEMLEHKCRRHAEAKEDMNFEVGVQGARNVNADTFTDTEENKDDVCAQHGGNQKVNSTCHHGFSAWKKGLNWKEGKNQGKGRTRPKMRGKELMNQSCS